MGRAMMVLESIRAMVRRLEHVQECDGEGCDLSNGEIMDGLGYLYRPGMTPEEIDECREEYHDEDAAREAIQEAPLDVEVRSDWQRPGDPLEPAEYMILLCTGGPAVRLVGRLGAYGQPETARLEHRDWFTAWQDYPLNNDEERDLLAYARVVIA